MSDKVTWDGHEFSVHQHGANWSDTGGVYIFAGITPQNQWKAYYIGKAESFQSRIPSHDRWNEAVRLGATHVHARAVSPEATRVQVEAQLIQAFQPPLNVHLK